MTGSCLWESVGFFLSPTRPVQVARWSELRDREPAYALVGEVDVVVVRWDDRLDTGDLPEPHLGADAGGPPPGSRSPHLQGRNRTVVSISSIT